MSHRFVIFDTKPLLFQRVLCDEVKSNVIVKVFDVCVSLDYCGKTFDRLEILNICIQKICMRDRV